MGRIPVTLTEIRSTCRYPQRSSKNILANILELESSSAFGGGFGRDGFLKSRIKLCRLMPFFPKKVHPWFYVFIHKINAKIGKIIVIK